jgi:hypothetical protein
MPLAQGIKKQTTYGTQTALGTPKVGAGGQILRRKTAVFTATRDMFENDEIVSHQQSTGVTYGLKKVAGKIEALLSSGTYKDLFAAGLRKAFAVTSAMAAGVDVTATVGAPQFVDASAGYLTAGLKVGDVGRWTGFTTSGVGNNARNFLITALTAGNMTGVFLDGLPAAAKAAGDNVTFTLVGKKTLVPLTGHTDVFFTFEEWYSDLSRSERFDDCKVNQIAFNLPATGNATCSFDIIGLSRTLAGAQSFSTPAAETTTGVMSALNGAVYVNAAKVGNITGAQITLDCGIKPVSAVLGSNVSPDMDRGRVRVSGTFTGLFDSNTIQALYDAETPTSLIIVVSTDPSATADFVTFTMGRIKLTGDAPDDGEKSILRTYPFTAELNSTGGPALAWDQTILTIQDSQA